jgi:hypothetical protein
LGDWAKLTFDWFRRGSLLTFIYADTTEDSLDESHQTTVHCANASRFLLSSQAHQQQIMLYHKFAFGAEITDYVSREQSRIHSPDLASAVVIVHTVTVTPRTEI